jgi:hypothetical protein
MITNDIEALSKNSGRAEEEFNLKLLVDTRHNATGAIAKAKRLTSHWGQSLVI